MVSYDLLLFMLKIETTSRITNSMPFLVFRRDHLRSTAGIICGPIWGSFPVWESFAVGDHLRRCTDLTCTSAQTRSPEGSRDSEQDSVKFAKLKTNTVVRGLLRELLFSKPFAISVIFTFENTHPSSSYKKKTILLNPALWRNVKENCDVDVAGRSRQLSV